MLLTIIIFIIILSLLVFVHEFGHLLVARKAGVKAEEFGFGFPPRAFGIQFLRGQTRKKVRESEKIDVEISEIKNEDKVEVIHEKITDVKEELDEVSTIKKWKL